MAIETPSWLQPRSDPYSFYRHLRETDPVHFDATSGVWLVTGYGDCVAVLKDPRFSAKEAHRLRRRSVALAPTMLNSDPPEHTRLRSAASHAWNAAHLRALEQRFQAIIDDLTATLEGRETVDLIGDYAKPLAAQTLAAAVGAPEENWSQLHRWLIESAGNVDPMAPPRTQERGAAAAERMESYFASLVGDRRHDPRQDLLSAFVRATGQHAMTTAEILDTCNLLLIGGYEPLVNFIGNGVLALLRHPGGWNGLRMNSTIPLTAVDELLRFDSPIPFVSRVATTGVVLHGREIRPGDVVIPILASANRDPATFDEPDRLDLSRDPNPHLAFGTGTHQCFGAGFTKMIGQRALGTLVKRFPRMEVVTPAPEWRPSVVPRGLQSLLVRAINRTGEL